MLYGRTDHRHLRAYLSINVCRKLRFSGVKLPMGINVLKLNCTEKIEQYQEAIQEINLNSDDSSVRFMRLLLRLYL